MPPTLHISAYDAPAVRIGDRVDCLFRDCTCVVTSFSSAPISWPRVQPLGQRGGSGLLVNDELAKAIRTESAEALKYHFGASPTTIGAWRKCFGVSGHTSTPGTRKAHHAASKLGAAVVKAKEWTDEECDARAVIARARGARPGPRWTPERGSWSPEEVALLELLTDAEVAAQIGRTVEAVRAKRRGLRRKVLL